MSIKFNKKNFRIVLLLSLVFCSPLNAAIINSNIDVINKTADEPQSNKLFTFMTIEAVLLFKSYWVSKSPNSYGGLMMLLAPLGVSNNTELVFAEIYGLYYLTLDDTKQTEQERFDENFISLNILLAAFYLLELSSDEDEKITMGFMPTNEGVRFSISYNF